MAGLPNAVVMPPHPAAADPYGAGIGPPSVFLDHDRAPRSVGSRLNDAAREGQAGEEGQGQEDVFHRIECGV